MNTWLKKFYVIEDQENNKFYEYQYSRGYLISDRPITVKENWIKKGLFENLYITYDPRLESVFVGDDNCFVLILGVVMDTIDWRMELDLIANKCLTLLLDDKIKMYDYLDELCGRYLICYGDCKNQFILPDATCLRSCFYFENGGMAASHYGIIGEIIKAQPHAFMEKYISYRPIPWLLPGTITPYQGVYSLTANHELNFNTGKIKRFWPRKDHQNLSANEAMEYIAHNVGNQMITLNNYHKLMVQLTKGNDSRISLAASKPIKENVLYYSFFRSDDPNGNEDPNFAAKYSEYLHLNYKCVNLDNSGITEKDFKQLCNVITTNHYHHYIYKTVPSFLKELPKDRLNIRSSLVEIVREWYWDIGCKVRDKDHSAELFCKWAGYPENDNAECRQLFEKYYSENQYDNIYNYLIPDIFYWEYRQGLWMNGGVMSYDDISFDTYILFNCRKILEYGLSIPRYFKNNNLVVKSSIQKLWKEVFDPVPKTDYLLMDYYNENNAFKVPIKEHCTIDSNIKCNNIYLTVGRYNATLGFANSVVNEDDYIELWIDFSVKEKNVYTIQIGICANYSENAENSGSRGYYIKIDNDMIYQNNNLKSFFNKENQINAVKYFETGGVHKLKIGLRSNSGFASILDSAGVIHIEYIKLIYSTHIYKIPEKTIVKTSFDLFEEMKVKK